MIIFQTLFKVWREHEIASETVKGNNSESMKARVVIFVRNTLSRPVLYSCEVSRLYSKGYLSYRADTKLHLKWSRGNNSESMIARVAILVCHTSSRPILHICKESLQYTLWFLSYWADTKLHLKPSMGNKSESMKARVFTLVRNTSSWPVLHNWEVSCLCSKQFLSYGADTKLHLKPSRENNSENLEARVVILVRDTLSWPVLHNWEVLWLYSKGYSSYRADMDMH